jgi:phenylpyruvate tautomerase PptA (4-oxalocrotonate tautomerase family)
LFVAVVKGEIIMASILAVGNAPVPEGKLPEFIEKVGTAVTSGLGLAPNLRSVYYIPLSDEQVTPKAKPDITFFVYTAPDKTAPQKRQMIANIQAAVDDFFGAGEVGTVVIVKIHADENVGVNGVVRTDAKAIAAQAKAQAAAHEG